MQPPTAMASSFADNQSSDDQVDRCVIARIQSPL